MFIQYSLSNIIILDPCDPNLCQNGGTCVNISITTFECTCPEGYSGNTCGVDLTPCDPHPCGSAGTCTDLGGGAYICECSLPHYSVSTVNTNVTQCPLFTFGNYTSGQCQPCKYDIIIIYLLTVTVSYYHDTIILSMQCSSCCLGSWYTG